ncbi:MAG: GMP synthase subunit A [Candidatus Methanomethylophilaceae archaeon]|nr:hypothetical protein [Candidatus Methanomethylophilaceae archaeon]
MKVYIIDNGGQWTHREWRVLRDMADARIVRNDTPPGDLADADALVLSGGAPSVASDAGRMGRNSDYLEMDVPIFGICAGMQFLSEHFGGTLGPGDDPEYGAVELTITSHDDIFKGMPDAIEVWASHNDEVKTVPDGFDVTASSVRCKAEAVRCRDRPIFGVQFHPEVENTQYGPEMFRNFLEIASRHRNG